MRVHLRFYGRMGGFPMTCGAKNKCQYAVSLTSYFQRGKQNSVRVTVYLSKYIYPHIFFNNYEKIEYVMFFSLSCHILIEKLFQLWFVQIPPGCNYDLNYAQTLTRKKRKKAE